MTSFMNDPLLDNISMPKDDCFVQKTRTSRSILAQNIFLPVEMSLKVGQRALLDGLVKLPDLVLGIHSLKQEDLTLVSWNRYLFQGGAIYCIVAFLKLKKLILRLWQKGSNASTSECTMFFLKEYWVRQQLVYIL